MDATQLSAFANGQDWAQLVAQPVAVPADFMGIHSNSWPMSGSDLPPIFPFGSFRLHDCSVGWATAETSPGVYDWTLFRKLLSALPANVLSVVLVLVGTPDCYIPESNKKSGQATDSYGHVGGGAPPNDPQAAGRYAVAFQAFLTAEFPHLKLKVELWNEPGFEPSGFWWGTVAQLVEQSVAVRQARDAAGMTFELISPSMGPNDLAAFLSTRDAASGQYGWWACDAVAIHQYGQYATSANGHDDMIWGPAGVEQYRAIMRSFGGNVLPVYITEMGISAGADSTLRAFLSSPDIVRRERIKGMLYLAAAIGVKGVYLYAYGGANLSGDMVRDGNNVVAAIANVQTVVAGQTMIDLRHNWLGAMQGSMANGNALEVQGWKGF